MIKFWDGKCLESLEPNMYLSLKYIVDVKGSCYWCEDIGGDIKDWFVAEFIGECSEGGLVFKIYETVGVGTPIFQYDAFHLRVKSDLLDIIKPLDPLAGVI